MTQSAVADHQFGPVAVYLGEKSGKYPDGNQLIVRGTDATAAFDSPLVSHRIGAAYTDCDLVIQGHIHEDHIVGLPLIPERPVYAHRGDIEMLRTREGYAAACGFPDDIMDAMFKDIEAAFHYQPRPDAIAYDDGAEWDLGGGVKVTAVHMPGHTSGHCVLLIDPVEVAFLGDIDLTGFGPYYGDATSSLSDFRRTLKRVPDLPASVWVTSHHRGVYTDRAEMLSALAAFNAKIDQRSETLLQRIRERPCTLASLVAQRLTYPPHYTPSWVPVVEQRTISLHLDELMAAGEISLEDERYFVLA